MAHVSGSSPTYSNVNQHYGSTNRSYPYNLGSELFIPQDLGVNLNLRTESGQGPNIFPSAHPDLDNPLNPTPPISIPPELQPHSYDPVLAIGITPENTFDTFACLPQTEPYQPQFDNARPFQDLILTNSFLFPGTLGTGMWPVTSQDSVSYTTPTQPHHSMAVLYHHLRDLTDQLKLLLGSHISCDILSSNPFPLNPVTMADFDLGYQPPNLGTPATPYTTNHLPDLTLIPQTQHHELSENFTTPSAHQPTNRPESPLASTFQMQPTLAYQRPTTGSKSSTASGESPGRGGVGGPRYSCDWDGCDKSFRRPYLLADHKRGHTGGATSAYQCKFEGCTRVYNSRSNLTRHFKSHICAGKSRDVLSVNDGQMSDDISQRPPAAGPSTRNVRSRTSAHRSDQATTSSGNVRFRPYENSESVRRRLDKQKK